MPKPEDPMEKIYEKRQLENEVEDIDAQLKEPVAGLIVNFMIQSRGHGDQAWQVYGSGTIELPGDPGDVFVLIRLRR